MKMDYEIGQKIKYRLPDPDGKAHWFNGVIHGVRKQEEGGVVTKVTYVVDTGLDERVDEHAYDPRQREIDRRLTREIKKDSSISGPALLKKVEEIEKHDDLPKSELKLERVRQPKQIELPAESIKPRK